MEEKELINNGLTYRKKLKDHIVVPCTLCTSVYRMVVGKMD